MQELLSFLYKFYFSSLHLFMKLSFCLFFNQIVGRSLEFNLANLLVSLLAVVLKMPLQDYDALYGTEIINFNFVCFIFMDCYCLFSPTLSALIF